MSGSAKHLIGQDAVLVRRLTRNVDWQLTITECELGTLEGGDLPWCSSVPDRPHMIVVSFFWSCSTLFGRLLPNTLQTQHFISSANRGSAFGTPVGVLCS